MKKKSEGNAPTIISLKKEKISDQQIFEHWKRIVSKIKERGVKGEQGVVESKVLSVDIVFDDQSISDDTDR